MEDFMTAAYALTLVLAFQPIDSAPLPPVAPHRDGTYLACTYFDFNRNVNYRSRVFPVQGVPETPRTDVSIFTEAFSKAITAQYKVPVDMRHVHCDTVGAWRVESELQNQAALDAGTVNPPEDGRYVKWPTG
jgi:hypothetical protein